MVPVEVDAPTGQNVIFIIPEFVGNSPKEENVLGKTVVFTMPSLFEIRGKRKVVWIEIDYVLLVIRDHNSKTTTGIKDRQMEEREEIPDYNTKRKASNQVRGLSDNRILSL